MGALSALLRPWRSSVQVLMKTSMWDLPAKANLVSNQQQRRRLWVPISSLEALPLQLPHHLDALSSPRTHRIDARVVEDSNNVVLDVGAKG